jgi:site-specific recombinase XerD
MLGVQDNGRAPVRASEVEALRDIDLPVWSVLQILSTAGALIEDRTPRIDLWFAERVDPLPQPMASELHTWFEIKKNGVNTPPRMRPRDHNTIRLQLGWALPTLQAWAAIGHTSLREISRQDILNALPPSSPERPRVGQGLKSIFRLLKARKIIFVDPTSRIKTGEHEQRTPLPLDPQLVAARLHSNNPATNVIVALIAFHGLRLQQLQRLQLISIHDGKLTIDGRTIPLAQPVRYRLAAYLTDRNSRWPEALNPHLFINGSTWRTNQPASPRYFHLAIGPGLTPRQLREDRILNEATATGGDIRALTDLFGLSINASTRYVSRLEHDDLAPTKQ